jgi:hypothetical protein
VDHPAKMIGCNDVDLKNMTMLNMFLFFFPSQFLHKVLLLQLNKSLQEQKECHRMKKNKEIGDVNALNGTIDGVPYYNIMCMKDGVDYTIKLMSTYGSTLPMEAASNRFRFYIDANGNKATKEFKYTECFENHFLYYRHSAVNDHSSNLRHSDISLEETWSTH